MTSFFRKLSATLILLSGLVQMGHGQDLLPSEQAFLFDVERNEKVLTITWDIADDYYMYKDKVSVSIEGDAIQTADLVLPKGKPKLDMALTGEEVELEVYTGLVTFEIPVEFEQGSQFTLIAKGQGCNEPVGVCYPPISHEINYDTTSANQPQVENALFQSSSNQIALSNPVQDEASENEVLSSVDKLRQLLATGLQEQEFLEVDDAFKLSVKSVEDNHAVLSFEIADGYYLYKEKTRFSGEGEVRIGDAGLPDGVMKQDPTFGEMEVFKKDFEFPLSLIRQGPDATEIQLFATYQGCAEDGICYAPVNKTYTLALPQIISTAVAQSNASESNSEVNVSATAASSSSSTASATSQSSELQLLNPETQTPLKWLLIGAFVAGLALAFTPCVLPMIPILSSVIAGQGQTLTKFRGGMLATCYVLGTAVTYAAMGAIAGATGDQLQAYFQSPLAIGILCLILGVMALAMFGILRVQMPSSIQSRLQDKTSKLGGTIPLVFILGLISALIVGACVSPVLISFLGIAIAKGDPVLGAWIMVLMALGMGIPLIILGFGAGHFIPKAGAWMERVNHVFGVMLIGVAIYLLQALPDLPILLIWGTYLIIVSVYLGATSSLAEQANGWRHLFKGIGIVLLVWGVLVLIGGFLGQRDVFNPIPQSLLSQSGSVTQSNEPQEHLFTRIANETELNTQLGNARTEDKFVMIDYYADWCVDCVRMERSTFLDPTVRQTVKDKFVALQVDVTDPNDVDRKNLKKRFGVFGPPAVLFLDKNGSPIKSKHFYGYKDTKEFLEIINSI